MLVAVRPSRITNNNYNASQRHLRVLQQDKFLAPSSMSLIKVKCNKRSLYCTRSNAEDPVDCGKLSSNNNETATGLLKAQ